MKTLTKICSIVLVLCMLLTTQGLVAFAGEEGRVYHVWKMEPNSSGSSVTLLQMTDSSYNQGDDAPFNSTKGNSLSSSDYTEDRKGQNALGIDGTAAYSFKILNSTQVKKFFSLINADTSAINSVKKDGYVYFKSAMMKLNRANTESGVDKLTVWNHRESDKIKGFATTAGEFGAKYEAYMAADGSGKAAMTGNIANSNWLNGNNPGEKSTIVNEVTDSWSRVTEAMYCVTGSNSGKDRSGWVIASPSQMSSDLAWGTVYWSQKWELLVDDYVELEVPATAIKSVSYPVVYGAKLDKNGTQQVGTVLNASYEGVYDVNPMLDAPAVKYVWQRSSDGSAWEDISGATKDTYTITNDDTACVIRVKITAENKTFGSDNSEKGTAISEPSYSASVNTGVEYNGRIIREERMNTYGAVGTYLNIGGSNWNASSPLNMTVDLNSKTEGVEGYAASYKSTSVQAKGAAMLGDFGYNARDRGPWKKGYTYFKSAMMKLNPENTDATTTSSGLEIWSIHDHDGKGFASDATGFKTNLNSYNGSTSFPSYDWGGTKDGTVKNTIKTDDWQRVTDCVYNADFAGDVRSGWVVWFKNWNTMNWTGNWELLVDDYIVLEVPNYALKSVAYPVAYHAQVKAGSTVSQVESGTSLTASAKYYDVNAMIDGTDDNYLTYQWQGSADGKAWTNISGETGSVYTPVSSDGYVRAEIRAISKTRDVNDAVLSTVSSEAIYSPAVKVLKPEASVSVVSNAINTDEFSYSDNDGKQYIVNGKSVIAYCKISNYDENSISGYGITFTVGENTLILPGIGITSSGDFGIRCFGSAIDSLEQGQYTIKAYIE